MIENPSEVESNHNENIHYSIYSKNGDTIMRALTILIPTIKHPSVSADTILTLINNICNKLKERYNLKLVWAVFQPKEIEERQDKDSQIVDFHKYENAIEILEMIKPDLIFIDGILEFGNTAFVMAGKLNGIPIVSIYFWHSFLKTHSKLNALRSKLRLVFSTTVPGDISNENQSRITVFGSILKKYNFLIKTLQKINYTPFQLLKFIFWYTKVRMSRYVIVDKIISGDLNFCFLPEWLEVLDKLGFEKSTLRVPGNPAFDNIFLQIQENKSKRNNDSNKTRILFCPSPLSEHGYITKNEQGKLIVSVVKEVLKNSEFELSVKIHPTTASRKGYENTLKNFSNKITFYQKEDVVNLINKHDVMVTFGGSTIALYGVLLKIPVIFITAIETNEFNQFFDKTMMIECKNLKTLSEKIKESKSKIISKDDYEKYTEKWIGKFDGKSSERIANEISDLLNQKK